MHIFDTIASLQEWLSPIHRRSQTIGFVPTMGYLHEGHLSLVHQAREHSDVVVVSIYVNPTQFGAGEDLSKYPRNPERDQKLLADAGADALFFPENHTMYPDGFHTYVNVEHLTRHLCGASRPTHFRGVTTIVTKLFNIVRPHVAVFGEKDFQQLAVIRKMVSDLNMGIQILGGKIIRDPDGLAMSSRNQYLSPDDRRNALLLSQSLQRIQDLYRAGERDTAKLCEPIQKEFAQTDGITLDYLEIVDADSLDILPIASDNARVLIAAYVGQTRLIDNSDIKVQE
jgi:pantoate--beta-alanine ligase